MTHLTAKKRLNIRIEKEQSSLILQIENRQTEIEFLEHRFKANKDFLEENK